MVVINEISETRIEFTFVDKNSNKVSYKVECGGKTFKLIKKQGRYQHIAPVIFFMELLQMMNFHTNDFNDTRELRKIYDIYSEIWKKDMFINDL